MLKVCYFASISPSFAESFAGRKLPLGFAQHTGHRLLSKCVYKFVHKFVYIGYRLKPLLEY